MATPMLTRAGASPASAAATAAHVRGTRGGRQRRPGLCHPSTPRARRLARASACRAPLWCVTR
eukprot:3351265-Rhodomonas_salina.2